jgi:hypothetical protein
VLSRFGDLMVRPASACEARVEPNLKSLGAEETVERTFRFASISHKQHLAELQHERVLQLGEVEILFPYVNLKVCSIEISKDTLQTETIPILDLCV